MDRYWVGGTGTWDASSTTNWATSSGGSSGASAPTSADNVIFDSASSAAGYTVTVGKTANCNDITVSAPASGVAAFSLAATSVLNIYGSMLLNVSSSTWIATGSGAGIRFKATTTGKTITTNGITLIANNVNGSVRFDGVGGEWTLLGSFGVPAFAMDAGSFNTANYNITCSSNFGIAGGSFAKTINLGSSSVLVSGAWFNTGSNTTFNAGTSSVTCPHSLSWFQGGGFTFYNVSFTSVNLSSQGIFGSNTFNNLTIASRSSSGIGRFDFFGNQTINGTLSVQSGTTDPTKRIFFVSDVVGTQRTITAANIDIQCADFRDIVGAGAATWSDSTRSKYWGDCQGNSGITFAAGRSVYWNLAGSQNWSSNGWAATNNGTPNAQYFPLAQDTATFTEAGAAGTITVNGTWNISSIQMADGVSNRTTGFTLATGTTTPTLYGNATLFSALTLSGTGAITFAGRNSTQNITSTGVAFTQPLTVNSATGTVRLLDALTIPSTHTFTLTSGTLDLNNNSLTCGIFLSSNSNTRCIAFGTGTINLTGSNVAIWNSPVLNSFTYTGTPTVNSTYPGSVGQRIIIHGATSGATESNSLSFNVPSGSDTISIYSYVKNINLTGFSGTLNVNTRYIYGNLIIPAAVTVQAGTLSTIFAATSGTQQVTTNGQTLDFPVIKDGAGTLQLQDDLTLGSTRSFTHNAGTIDLNGKTLTVPGAYSTSNSKVRSINFGSGGIISLPGSGTAFNAATATNLTTSGTGSIDMTSASAKTFSGGGASYPTLNQSGSGALTVSGSNTFQDITNTYSATGATSVIFTSGTTNKFDAFNLTGASGAVCTLGATTTSQATIQKPTPWYMGANSTNGGNNTNLTFTAGGGIDYLSVSYIKGGTYFGIPFSEGVVQADDSTQQSAFLQTLAESITTGDSSVQASEFLQSLIESVVVGDESTQTSAFLQSITEPFSATDSQTTTSALLFTITEPNSVNDVRVVTAQFPLSLSEGTTVDDVRDILAGFAASQSENISTADANSQITAYHVTAAEAVEILDVLNTYGWIKINDAQYPGWIPVDSTQ